MSNPRLPPPLRPDVPHGRQSSRKGRHLTSRCSGLAVLAAELDFVRRRCQGIL